MYFPYTGGFEWKQADVCLYHEWLENAHEAIIPPATFDMVQKLMLEDSRSPVGGEAVHLFSGKVFCADCHSSMIRRKTKSHGKEYVYFICGANKQNTLNHADQFQAILEFWEEYQGQQKNVQPVEKEVG